MLNLTDRMLLEADFVTNYLGSFFLEGLLIYFIVDGNRQYTLELQGNIQIGSPLLGGLW